MNKFTKLILLSSLLSPLGFCTTVSNIVDIQDSTLKLSRTTTVNTSGKITIAGNSAFNQNSNTLTNSGIIDIAGYTGDAITMNVDGTASDTHGLILGKAGSPGPDPVCILPDKISSITVVPSQTVHYYYTAGTTQYSVADELDTNNLIKLTSKTTGQLGINKDDYTTVTATSGGITWKNDAPSEGEVINVTITTVAQNTKNQSENTLNLETEGLDPVLDAGNSVNVKLAGDGQITFKGSSDTIATSDVFTFAGDNSNLSTQTLPANATLQFIGNRSLFPHNAVTSKSVIGHLVFGDGTNVSENSIQANINTKKLEVKQSATLNIDSEKSLVINDYGSQIAGTIKVSNGGSLTF